MKILNIGDVTYGNSHADMINKAIGTNFTDWWKCSVDLCQFGVPDVIAWFIFMDGSEHGYEEGWRWANYLSYDGNEVKEYNISPSHKMVTAKRNEEGYLPYRLCFRLDPYKIGNRYCCKFVGAFSFFSFLREDLTAIKYAKVSDTFRIGAKGETGSYLGCKDDLIGKESRYYKPISELGFSENVHRLLKRGKIRYAGELLELGLGVSGEVSDEIRLKLFECFKDKDM